MKFLHAAGVSLFAVLLVLPARAAEAPVVPAAPAPAPAAASTPAPAPAADPAPGASRPPAAAQPASPVRLLHPPDLTFTNDPKVKVFAFRPQGGPPVVPVVNGKAAAPLDGEMFPKGEVSLLPGMNLLQVGETTVRVFVLPGAAMETFRFPSGTQGRDLVFQAYRLHPALDDGCDGCHTVEGGKIQAKDQKEACASCHDDFTKASGGKKPFVHAPVASGECTACHDPHFATRPKLQKLEKDCFECHDPFPAAGTVHAPVAAAACVSCHSPHAGPAPGQLVRPGNALCLGCHKAPHDRHRSSTVLGMLTRVPEEFPKEAGELSCTGCHVPHQSQNGGLFRKPREELCRTCHSV